MPRVGLETVSVRGLVHAEQDAETGVGKDRVGKLEGNMKLGHPFGGRIRQAVRYQEFFNGEVRELNDVVSTVGVYYGHQTGTGRQHRVLLVFPRPSRVRPSVDREHLRKLLDPKRLSGHREALQEPMGVLSVRLVDPLQDALVCFVQ